MRNRPQPKWLVPLFRLLTYQFDKADVCNVQYAMPPTVFEISKMGFLSGHSILNIIIINITINTIYVY